MPERDQLELFIQQLYHLELPELTSENGVKIKHNLAALIEKVAEYADKNLINLEK